MFLDGSGLQYEVDSTHEFGYLKGRYNHSVFRGIWYYHTRRRGGRTSSPTSMRPVSNTSTINKSVLGIVEHVTDVHSLHWEPCINMAHNACRGPTRISLFDLPGREFGRRRGST
jgi:hypothetical protein